MPTAETSHGEIWYANQRQPDAKQPPLLLIHGAGGSHLDWPRDLRRMNSLVVDLPGHGKSAGIGYETIEAYAQSMADFLAALQVDRAFVAGHSMGGAISMMMALEHSDRVAGLVLIGTGARLRVHSDILNSIRENPEQVGTLFKTWMWGQQTEDIARQRGYELFMQSDPYVAYHDYLACDRFDIRDRLGEIAVPALIIGGSDDRMTPLRYSEYLRDHIRDSSLTVIEGGGHMMALEYPAQVAAAVAAWIAGL